MRLGELIDLFKRFDLTAIEYKPFTRFTVAKYLDDLTNNELSKYLNNILRDRKTGCFIIRPEKLTIELMIFF
jgi:protein CsiD